MLGILPKVIQIEYLFGSDPHSGLYSHTKFWMKITKPGLTRIRGADMEKESDTTTQR